MRLILVDAAGVVVGADEGRGPRAPGWAGIGDLGVSLLDRLSALADPDALALAAGLRAVLDGHQRRFVHPSLSGDWQVRVRRLLARKPPAVALLFDARSAAVQAPTGPTVPELQHLLELAERRLADVQQVAGLGSWYALDGRLQVSPQAYQVMGVDPAQGALDPACVRLRVHADDLPGLRADRERVMAGQPNVMSRFRFRDDDGNVRWIEARVTLEPGSPGQPRCVVGTVRDISVAMHDQHELQRHRDRLEDLVVSRTVQLAEASERAEAASRAKSAFLAQTSHEIRSPLNVIVSLAHLLQPAEADPSRRRRVQAIEQAGRHLSSIIDDVLDLARAENNRLALHIRTLCPAVVLDEVAAMLRPEAEDRGLHIEVEAAGPGGGRPLRGDAARLRQALLNAGRWAIAASPSGQIRLRLRTDTASDERVALSLEILSAAALPGPAFDVDPDLVAMRRLARLMNGRCGIDSDGAGGSRCWFRVELEVDPDAQALLAAPLPPDEASLVDRLRQRHAGRRVLVAEDEEVNQLVMLELLAELDLVVEMANDGQAAVEKAARRHYALILMDLRMPRLDGLGATRAIRALPGLQHTPIIAITANAFEEDRAACRAAGMNDFLPKPIDVDRLHETLLHWLDRSPAAPSGPVERLEPAVPAQAPAMLPAPGVAAALPPTLPVQARVAPSAPPDPVDLDDPQLAPLLALEGVDAIGGLAAVGGKVALYRRLLAVFDQAHREDGEQLRQALLQPDHEAAARLAHRVRGSAATLGLVDIETAASALEHALDETPADTSIAALAHDVDEALAGTLLRLRRALQA